MMNAETRTTVRESRNLKNAIVLACKKTAGKLYIKYENIKINMFLKYRDSVF